MENQDQSTYPEGYVPMDADLLKACFLHSWARIRALKEVDAALSGIFHAFPDIESSANHSYAHSLLKAMIEMEEGFEKMEDVPNIHTLELALGQVLNRFSAENQSDTPDYVLATFITQAFDAFNSATRLRDHHYDFNTNPTLEGSPIQRVPEQGATGPRPVKISGRDELRLALQIWQHDPETCKADKSLAEDLLCTIEDGDTGDIALNPRRALMLVDHIERHDQRLSALIPVHPWVENYQEQLDSILQPIYESIDSRCLTEEDEDDEPETLNVIDNLFGAAHTLKAYQGLDPRWNKCAEEVLKVLNWFDRPNADINATFTPSATGNASADSSSLIPHSSEGEAHP